jgi:hypothetical protein
MSQLFTLSKTFQRFGAAASCMQVANFSKYISKSRTKRLPLTTKRVGKGYNKGNGARKEGVLDSKGNIELISVLLKSAFDAVVLLGRFRLVKDMRTELIVPDLTGFTLKAYVAPGAKRNVREAVVSV